MYKIIILPAPWVWKVSPIFSMFNFHNFLTLITTVIKFLREKSCQFPFECHKQQKLITLKYFLRFGHKKNHILLLLSLSVDYDISPLSMVKFSQVEKYCNTLAAEGESIFIFQYILYKLNLHCILWSCKVC